MLCLTYSRRDLRFNFPARTSRGALTTHTAYFLHLHEGVTPAAGAPVGLGEAAPLAGLSPDFSPDFEAQVAGVCQQFNEAKFSAFSAAQVPALIGPDLPALRFALETAALDYARGGTRQLYDNAFARGQQGIPINGLVWMGDAAFMRQQIKQKLTAGFSCLKLKIGSLDFATELDLLAEIRAVAGPADLTLRVDANGAFSPEEAPARLDALSQFAIHSIEQPIRAGQPAALAGLCQTSPIPVALDEELIGVTDPRAQELLLDTVRPAYIVLKPTLLGGHAATRHWIALAQARRIGWWLTSALESNVGLNAVAQLTGEYELANFAQGLGTGQLYHNNIAAPLDINQGKLYFAPEQSWEMP
jgi:O-succinylbenzoate synthase